jgi:hypothetical protein
MLRTNLSTRPFYNLRAVQMALGAFAALVIFFSLFNVFRLVQLGTSQRSLGARAVEADQQATKLRTDAARIRAQVDAKELEVVSAAAREANEIIDLRTFSWSDLFSYIETTLPEGARVTGVQPRIEQDGRHIVAIRVEARQTQDLEKFLDALEGTGVFRDVLATDEQTASDGLIEAIVEAVYLQPGREPAVGNSAAAPTRPPGGANSD